MLLNREYFDVALALNYFIAFTTSIFSFPSFSIIYSDNTKRENGNTFIGDFNFSCLCFALLFHIASYIFH